MDPSHISNPCWGGSPFFKLTHVLQHFAHILRVSTFLAQEDFSVQHFENMRVSSKALKSARFIKKRYETPNMSNSLARQKKKCYD